MPQEVLEDNQETRSHTEIGFFFLCMEAFIEAKQCLNKPQNIKNFFIFPTLVTNNLNSLCENFFFFLTMKTFYPAKPNEDMILPIKDQYF